MRDQARLVLRPRFYSAVTSVLRSARRRALNTVNSTMIEAYWNLGRLIVQEEQQGNTRAEYAVYLIRDLATRLTQEFGRGYSQSNLKSFRQFFLAFPASEPAAIRQTLSGELTWSHYCALLRVSDPAARSWYAREAAEQGWVVRTLTRQINSFAYQRTLKSGQVGTSGREKRTRKAAVLEPREFIKDPYVLEFLEVGTSAPLHETTLEQAIIGRLQDFMLELGKGFAFVGRQYRVSTDTKHFFIDLVFYNYILKCFVLVDLKTGDLTHQDIGQMDMYVRVFEDTVKGTDDNPTIGLILCSDKDKSLVKYSVLNESRQLFASKYRPYLPSEAELQAELERERTLVNDATAAPRGAPVPLLSSPK